MSTQPQPSSALSKLSISLSTFAVLATVLLVTPAIADEVALEKQGDTYTVPVIINGAVKIKFTLDSGASDVQIPADVVLTLIRAGTLTQSDFIGNQTYSQADGSTLQSPRFTLHEIKVGNQILRNIVASVGTVKSEALLGQSFLSRFGSWTLDNHHHILILGQPGQGSPGNPAVAQSFDGLYLGVSREPGEHDGRCPFKSGVPVPLAINGGVCAFVGLVGCCVSRR